MPKQIATAGLHLRVTLEVSTTGDGTATPVREIALDYPISTVIGVFDANSEAGTNFYDAECSHDGSKILLSEVQAAAIGGASTTVYVSYRTEAHLPVMGYPAPNHQGAVMAVVHAMPLKLENDPSVDYEIADPIGAGSIATGIISGSIICTITHIKVLTDGTNVALYLYSGNTATRANMEFRKLAINVQWFSTDDYSDLKIAFDTGYVYLALVDTGANATPANTYIDLRGHVGI